MGEQKRLKSLSAITRNLIASGEGQLVDFKRAPDGISAEDLVAFANAPEGGTILAGIEEQIIDGMQTGRVIGCDVSDNTILQILNKAIGCFPPVSVDIVLENLNEKPILRISIPASTTKPHCTPKGLYCRRDGSRNRALHPSELLKIFLDTEEQMFATRFKAAADHISESIESLSDSLSETIEEMATQLGWAESNLDDTSNTLGMILSYTKRLSDETDDIATRLRAIFRQDKREDPVRDRELKELTQQLIDQITENKELLSGVLDGKGLSYKLVGKKAAELTEKDGEIALINAVKTIRNRGDTKDGDKPT